MVSAKRLGVVASFFSLALLSSTWAKAEDFTFPGIACRLNGTDTFFPYGASEIQNTSATTTFNLFCPATNTNNGRTVSGVVNTNFDPSWNSRSCLFALNTYDGATTFIWPTAALTHVGASYQFAFQAVSLTSSYDYSGYVFQCAVPPGQIVYKYDVER